MPQITSLPSSHETLAMLAATSGAISLSHLIVESRPRRNARVRPKSSSQEEICGAIESEQSRACLSTDCSYCSLAPARTLHPPRPPPGPRSPSVPCITLNGLIPGIMLMVEMSEFSASPRKTFNAKTRPRAQWRCCLGLRQRRPQSPGPSSCPVSSSSAISLRRVLAKEGSECNHS